MFDIPARYAANNAIEPKTFILKEMKKQDKDRIRENLLEVRLAWQIMGEEIPSLIDAHYNCSVIMGLDIKLKAVKDRAAGSSHVKYFAELVQHTVKAPCVVRFYNHAEEAYSFAHKRLSHTDATQIVIVDMVQTPPLSLMFPDKTAEKLRQYLAFDALRNKTDKLNLYLEVAVKAFIISNPNLYSGIDELLDRKLWYNRADILALFGRLLELSQLNAALKTEKLPGERAKLSGEIRKIKEELQR